MKALLSTMFAAVAALVAQADSVVTNAADLARIVYRERKADVAFDITGAIPVSKSAARHANIYPIDDSGGVVLLGGDRLESISLRAGDRIRAKGRTDEYDFGQVVALCESIEIVGHGPAPMPEPVSIEELRSGRFDCHYVKIRGTLRDAFDDEVDGHYTYLALSCDGTLLYAPAPKFNAGSSK